MPGPRRRTALSGSSVPSELPTQVASAVLAFDGTMALLPTCRYWRHYACGGA